jgi:starch synthase
MLSRVKVLFIASEAAPLVKVGGLADVAGSLPLALKRLKSSVNQNKADLDVRLVIPFHPVIQSGLFAPQQIAEYTIRNLDGEIPVQAYSLELDGLPVYLIAGPPIDQETAVYSADLEADGYKYVYFSLAALELARNLGWKFNILHANDWHSAAAVYALALNRPTDPFLYQTTSLLTIHNLPYLGSMTPQALKYYGLPPATSSILPAWAQYMALPLGLLTADSIVAVSPEYAKEILSEEFGSGLDSFLKTRPEVISGILNGLDTDKWNPSIDVGLAMNFSSSNLTARFANKSFLQQQLGLEINPRLPIMAMVTRMDPQKGVDLAVDALRALLQASPDHVPQFQVVFLGTGNTALEAEVLLLEHDYHQQVCARILFDERLSHHIYAGADILLMPSRYEPCGLSQMIAMHYGCVPVARATGGLSDSIQDSTQTDMSTGFLFKQAKPDALADAILRALHVYLEDPAEWQAIQIRGMQQDFSWDRSAREYLKKYKLLMGR